MYIESLVETLSPFVMHLVMAKHSIYLKRKVIYLILKSQVPFEEISQPKAENLIDMKSHISHYLELKCN